MKLSKMPFAMLVALAIAVTGSTAIAANLPGPVNKTKTSQAKVKIADNNKKTDPEQQAPAPKAPVMVTVQPGDYLEKLATANNTTSLRLFYANTDIANPDLIYPNQRVRVPEAEETLTPREVPVNQQIATPSATESTQAASPRTARPATAVAPISGDTSVWDRLAACESGGNWGINTGNGYYGGLQFTQSSWQSVGGSGSPSDASREEQIARGQALQSRSGWGAWPACSAKLGL